MEFHFFLGLFNQFKPQLIKILTKGMIARTLFRTLSPFTRVNVFAPIRLGTPVVRYQFTSSSDPTQAALLEEVEAKVYQVLKSAAKCDQAKLARSATFEELGFDSLDGVELVVAMEEYFGFDIPNEEAEKIATVEAAVNTFYRHLNARIANKVVESEGKDEVKPEDK